MDGLHLACICLTQGRGEVTASDVILVDTRTILLQDFSFTGDIPGKLSVMIRNEKKYHIFSFNSVLKKKIINFHFCFPVSETFFMVGTGPRASSYGTQLSDETGSMRPLTTYRRKSVLLTLPANIDVSSIDWFSVWSQSLQTSLAQVSLIFLLSLSLS